MTARAKSEIRSGRQLIIFPEGTRRAPGAEPRYKFGVAHLYAEIGVPCVPVALNSGLFWPRRSFLPLARHDRGRIPAADPAGARTRMRFSGACRATSKRRPRGLLAEGRAELERLGVV